MNITIINCEEILFQAVKRYEDEDIDDFIGTIENVISEDATKQDEAEYQMDYIMENFDEIMYEMENIIAESYEGRGFIESTCEEYPHNYLKCIADYNEKMEAFVRCMIHMHLIEMLLIFMGNLLQ